MFNIIIFFFVVHKNNHFCKIILFWSSARSFADEAIIEFIRETAAPFVVEDAVETRSIRRPDVFAAGEEPVDDGASRVGERKPITS
jgi:hypothetical protein